MTTRSCDENDPQYMIQQLLVKMGDPVGEKKALTPEEFTTQLGEHLHRAEAMRVFSDIKG